MNGRKRSDGAPGGIRTPGLQIRSLPLYPAELQAREASLHQVAGSVNAEGVFAVGILRRSCVILPPPVA